MKTRFFIFSFVVAVCLIGCKTPKNLTTMTAGTRHYGSDVLSERAAREHTPSPHAEIGDLESGLGYAFNKESKARGGRISPLADYVGEELWIIRRPAREVNPAQDEQYPGSGTLMTHVAEKEVPLPLKHTDVKANVAAYIASVDVTQ